MKSLILILFLIMAIPAFACADDKITGIGENNVEVMSTKTVTDIDGNEVTVWDTSTTESYGQDVVDEERKALNTILTSLKESNCQEERDIQIKKHEDALIRLDKVQVELDKQKVMAEQEKLKQIK